MLVEASISFRHLHHHAPTRPATPLACHSCEGRDLFSPACQPRRLPVGHASVVSHESSRIFCWFSQSSPGFGRPAPAKSSVSSRGRLLCHANEGWHLFSSPSPPRPLPPNHAACISSRRRLLCHANEGWHLFSSPHQPRILPATSPGTSPFSPAGHAHSSGAPTGPYLACPGPPTFHPPNPHQNSG